MAQQQFEEINRVYWDSFGPSHLEVFLDDSPPKNGAFLWHLRKKMAQGYVFVYFPVFIFIEIWGIISRERHTLMSMSFDISLLSHNVQNYLKMRFWLTNLPKVRSLCLDFSKFHVSAHRPFLTSWILSKESKSIRNYVRRCYLITYTNMIFWIIIPTTQSLISYILYRIGAREPQATYIPRCSPSRYPFDMSSLLSRLIVFFLMEIPIFSLGFVYFQPIDMFLVTVIKMAAANFRALNAALFAMPADLEEFWTKKVPIDDTEQPMSLRSFIEDHQKMTRYGVRLRQFVSPILGLVTFNCVTIICNMSIVAAAQLKMPGLSPVEYGLAATASVLVALTCLIVFYTYTTMFGVLKDGEESVFHALYCSNWYEKDVQFRKNLIFIQKLNAAQRRIRMCGVGDMGRPTFIDGLRMAYSYYNFMQRFE